VCYANVSLLPHRCEDAIKRHNNLEIRNTSNESRDISSSLWTSLPSGNNHAF
jgi:hypothetical protein